MWKIDRGRHANLFSHHTLRAFSVAHSISLSCILTSQAHPCSLPVQNHFYNEKVILSTFWGLNISGSYVYITIKEVNGQFQDCLE